MLNKLYSDFLSNLIQELLGWIQFDKLLDLAFFAEQELSAKSGYDVSSIVSLFQDVGLYFIGIKFLLKGFNIYITYLEGDADASPFYLLTRFIKALAIALSFTAVYDLLMEEFITFIKTVEDTIFGSFFQTIPNLWDVLQAYLTSLPSLGFVIIWIIFSIILWIDFLKRGIETLILRIGIAWAAAGIINSDDGVFRPYLNKFFQNAITVMIQYILMIFSLRLALTSEVIWAIAMLSIARATPKFLQEFMIVTRGDGGMMNKAYYGVQGARSIVNFFRKSVMKG